jgi:hypothetical protein
VDEPVLFSAEKEVCEQDRNRGGGQAHYACSQSKKTEGVIRPRSEQARQYEVQLYECGAERENAAQ